MSRIGFVASEWTNPDSTRHAIKKCSNHCYDAYLSLLRLQTETSSFEGHDVMIGQVILGLLDFVPCMIGRP